MQQSYFRLNRLEKRPDGIICFYPEQDESFTAEDMLELLEVLKELADSLPIKLLFVLGDKQLLLTKSARNLYKTHEESRTVFKAQAVVFESRATQILLDLILKVYSPPYPLKAFTKVEDAERWLKAM